MTPFRPFRWLASLETSKIRALAQTNKQVASEALAVFYGADTFTVSTLQEASRFLERIDSSRKLLRTVQLTAAYCLDGWSGVWGMGRLLSMANLQSLAINHESIYVHALSTREKPKIDDLVGVLLPLLRRRHNASKNNGGGSNVLDLVTLTHEGRCSHCGCWQDRLTRICLNGRCPQKHPAVAKHHDKKCARLREIIAARLGLGQ